MVLIMALPPPQVNLQKVAECETRIDVQIKLRASDQVQVKGIPNLEAPERLILELKYHAVGWPTITFLEDGPNLEVHLSMTEAAHTASVRPSMPGYRRTR